MRGIRLRYGVVEVVMERTLFFDVLSLTWLCSFGDCFAEEGHEFANAVAGMSTVASVK